MHDGDALDRLIKDIRSAGAVSRPVVEKAAGLQLRAANEDEYFSSYVADTPPGGKMRLHLDLREPRPHSGATGGPLLVADITGACLERTAIEARYGSLTLTQVPHGHSVDEKMYWTKSEPWGELSFGFAERRPDCLASVVFEARPGVAR